MRKKKNKGVEGGRMREKMEKMDRGKEKEIAPLLLGDRRP